MNFLIIILALFSKLLHVENRMISRSDINVAITYAPEGTADDQNYEQQSKEKVIGLNSKEDSELEGVDSVDEVDKKLSEEEKRPCAIVVLSNVQNQSVRSLLRKYRYNKHGALIPSSVRYFIKLPQNSEADPILVPLNDKAFSPMGGFVRFYKEVPPIPRSW